MILYFKNSTRTRSYSVSIENNTTIGELKNLIKQKLNQVDITITHLHIVGSSKSILFSLVDKIALDTNLDSKNFIQYVLDKLGCTMGACSDFYFFTDAPKDQNRVAFSHSASNVKKDSEDNEKSSAVTSATSTQSTKEIDITATDIADLARSIVSAINPQLQQNRYQQNIFPTKESADNVYTPPKNT